MNSDTGSIINLIIDRRFYCLGRFKQLPYTLNFFFVLDHFLLPTIFSLNFIINCVFKMRKERDMDAKLLILTND